MPKASKPGTCKGPKSLITAVVKRCSAPNGKTYQQGLIDGCAWTLNGGTLAELERFLCTGEKLETFGG